MKKGAANVSDLEGIEANVGIAKNIAERVGMIASNGGQLQPQTIEIAMDAIRDLLQSVLADCESGKHVEPPSV